MTIRFFLRFTTRPGQSLHISGTIPQLGSTIATDALTMNYLDGQFWEATLHLPEELQTESFTYKYILREENGDLALEWGDDRLVELSRITAEEIDCIDTWNHPGEYENAFFTAPFQKVLLPVSKTIAKPRPYRGSTHVFQVKAPLLRKHECLCIVGNIAELGSWKSEGAVLLNKEDNWWTLKINLSGASFPIQYKYGVYDAKVKKFTAYESGDNRSLDAVSRPGKVTIARDGFARLPNATWHGAGVAIPVFSLRSDRGTGVGEFVDIKLLVDWAKATGMKLIQILPVNDTVSTHTWTDSYPYSAISAFALHPMFLNLEKVAGKEFEASIRSLKKKQKQLNDLVDMDYEAVMNFKLGVIHDLYQLQKDRVFSSELYQQFFEENKDWLVPYAAYCYHRDKYNSADFRTWKTNPVYDARQIEKLCAPTQKHYDKIAIHYFLQYHLHLQLQEAHDYANKHGIIVKGDIPIGVNRNSADAWTSPDLYNMNMQAGAPPDDFAVKGQNWGFPTYNWQRMKEDGYAWWKRRFEQMSRYFDAFRIDHILGFFRIWSIPEHAVEGIMGHFVPALPVRVTEFHQRNIWFDHNRYCKPFINDSILWEMFGGAEKKIKPFLAELGDGYYQLKEEFNTQKKIETHFSLLESSEDNDRLKHGLFDLVSNVILFEEEGAQGLAFHFRFNMQSTFSFRYLDNNTQQQLKELYIDYFFRRQDDFWKKEAMAKLPALKRASDMLICGEDLGMVPACVPDVMKQLGFLSLEIQRMPKDPKSEFFHPNDAPYLSVVTPSTHDMSTVRGWWEEERSKTQRFYNNEIGQYGEAPVFCEAWVNKQVVIQHLYSPSMWAVFQMQDILGIDEKLRRQDPNEERINVPANPKHYWKYRMHVSLEELLRQKPFTNELKQLITASGRI
jgi:4-alpha-glucanotransferase